MLCVWGEPQLSHTWANILFPTLNTTRESSHTQGHTHSGMTCHSYIRVWLYCKSRKTCPLRVLFPPTMFLECLESTEPWYLECCLINLFSGKDSKKKNKYHRLFNIQNYDPHKKFLYSTWNTSSFQKTHMVIDIISYLENKTICLKVTIRYKRWLYKWKDRFIGSCLR